ncbi:MAG TPA: type 4a pilus biogenesis protein PilO [Gemmatimonadales bacterium]
MALSDNPRAASILTILLALLAGYVLWSGDGLSLVGGSGLKARNDRVVALRDTIATVQASIDSAKRELARGSVEDVRQRVEEYRATLTLLRQFVPERNEVPNLLDDISSRAKVRGVNLSNVVPQPVQPGPNPFNTHSYEMSVVGRYDQIGRFLTDIAGLRRIIVPIELTMASADPAKAKALGDSTKAMLEAKFKVRTFVKSTGEGADEM